MEKNKYIICSIGLTAAGKTTTLRKIASICNIPFVSEGAIKRSFVEGDYNQSNSMDEELRSAGYKEAIKSAFDIIMKENCVIIDASFHQLFRRLWIYDEIENRRLSRNNTVVIWIYCVCEDENITAKRIKNRYEDPIKTADNQANTYEVYEYTKRTFDEVSLSDFNEEITTYVIKFSSMLSKIESVSSSDNSVSVLDLDIPNWRRLWENYM